MFKNTSNIFIKILKTSRVCCITVVPPIMWLSTLHMKSLWYRYIVLTILN